MKIILISFLAMMFTSFTREDKLTGKWETQPNENGNVTGVSFKPDNSFEGYVNKKPFTSGTYTLKDDVFTFSDNGCNGVEASYKIIFFSNNDSLRLQPITDSCVGRRNGMSRLVLGRVK